VLRLDSTRLSVVVLCSDCSWWRGFGFDKLDGWTTAARHEAQFHPEQEQARSALRMAESRI